MQRKLWSFSWYLDMYEKRRNGFWRWFQKMGLDFRRETTWVLLDWDMEVVGSICKTFEAWNLEIDSTKEHQPSCSSELFPSLWKLIRVRVRTWSLAINTRSWPAHMTHTIIFYFFQWFECTDRIVIHIQGWPHLWSVSHHLNTFSPPQVITAVQFETKKGLKGLQAMTTSDPVVSQVPIDWMVFLSPIEESKWNLVFFVFFLGGKFGYRLWKEVKGICRFVYHFNYFSTWVLKFSSWANWEWVQDFEPFYNGPSLGHFMSSRKIRVRVTIHIWVKWDF